MLFLYIGFVFAIGAAVGSWLNVCAYRLPFEKSVVWPGSRCGRCYQGIAWYDNIPLLSWWLLGGRCRVCRAPFSIRYFLVELFTGLAFVGLFWLEVVENVLGLPWGFNGLWAVANARVSWEAWAMFLFHAMGLLSFLLAASLCDLDHMEIPLSITMTGTLVGLVGSVFFPWPWPGNVPPPNGPALPLPSGAYPWPVWHPLPAWLPAGSWQLGLATGLAGALAGMVLLRGVRWLFGVGRGMEGLGLGDADLMMMAGSFLGWQPVVFALFLGTFAALFYGIFQVVFRGGQAMPFGPPLAVGTMAALLGWRWLGPPYQAIFFDPVILGILVGVGAFFLLATSFLLRIVRGPSADVS